MAAPGDTDLDRMLRNLSVDRRPGEFTYIEVLALTPDLIAVAQATVVEGEMTTVVLEVGDAEQGGRPISVRLAWLTLSVQSSLEAVGLTAAVSERLTGEGISCNVLAGYRHDHLLVPVARAEDAVAVLTS
ncbi:MAG: ACT domain-containing protein [Ilumatobacteraceae bacterium]|nr:ACT domain-containing protein [Ilumatobacteraceae bacterium]